MTKNKNFIEFLILLTLISFGFFGSLSHLFTAILILISCINFCKSYYETSVEYLSKALFLALTGCFFILCVTSLLHMKLNLFIKSISPMLPIPIIALLVVLQSRSNFKISSKKIANFSQISVVFSLLVYLAISKYFGPETFLYQFHSDRLSLFSGNPIPFSFSMLGLSIFCLLNWRNSNKKDKLLAIICFSIGIYMAGFQSGTRSTLLAFIIIVPALIFYVAKTQRHAFVLIALTLSLCSIFCLFYVNGILTSSYFDRIENGLKTLLLLKNNDGSVSSRLEMWTAALKAISEAPVLGYDISKRFDAIVPHLPIEFKNVYTHPHNDVLASTIVGGFAAGLAAVVCLISGLLAAILSHNGSTEKLYFGVMISCSVLVTANISTVFFNDISSAWLAFSTYLIWIMEFKKNDSVLKK